MSGHAPDDQTTHSVAGAAVAGSTLPSASNGLSQRPDTAMAESPAAPSAAPVLPDGDGGGSANAGGGVASVALSQKAEQTAHPNGGSSEGGMASASAREGGEGGSEVAALRVQDGNKPNQPKMLDKLYTCKWKNGTLQTARVVERRLDKFGNWEYYMHYEDFDRRLDEWVGADRLGDEVIKHRSSGEVASAESTQKMTRTQKRRFDEIHTTMPVDNDPTTAALEHEREQATKVKNIQTVELGKYEMETWYYSPYPEEFSKCAKLFLCEFCLKYFRKSKTLERHKGKCEWRHPPGDEVYRHDNVSMFEVDGKKAKIYCQVMLFPSSFCSYHSYPRTLPFTGIGSGSI
jgi:hypothetical protein